MGAIDVPWAVPVALVPRLHPPGGEVQEHVVDPGVALPGVRAVRIVLRRLDEEPDRPWALAHVAPEPARTGSASLADLLARLVADRGRLPVLVDGTPFSRAVLTALVRVPVGSRITYGRLAAEAGRPGAVRAAASVMARNRVPLMLPCHRVVPSGGGTGRYAWGEAVKVALLDAERGAVDAVAAG